MEAGLEVLARIERLAAEGSIPPTRVGLGLHAGPAIVGTIGSASRKEYTVVGDVVNVASRVEALNKEVGSQMLVTEEVWKGSNRAVDPQTIPTREISPLAASTPLFVRGREMPVRIFTLA